MCFWLAQQYLTEIKFKHASLLRRNIGEINKVNLANESYRFVILVII